MAAFWSPAGAIPRGTFWLRFLGLLALGVGAVLVGKDSRSMLPGVVLLASFLLLVFQVMKRARDAGLSWGWALLVLVPGVGLLPAVVVGLLPTKSEASPPSTRDR